MRFIAALPRVLSLVAALAVTLPAGTASGQQRGGRVVETGPRILVPTFASPDRELGVQIADALRGRISRDNNIRNVYVVPKEDVHANLTASGYSTTEALAPNDLRQLALIVRADEVLDGTIVRTPTGVKVDARLALARDVTIGQPLPSAEAARVDQAAQMISASLRNARGQLEAERNCYRLFSSGKHAEAEAAARAGLARNPNGTILGVCLGNALFAQNKSDSVLALAERIRAVDPRNIAALRWAADIYQQRRDPRASDALIALLAADPGNIRLQTQVVNSLAASGQAGRAAPIILDAVRNNPGDPSLLRTAWLVLLAAREYQSAVQMGRDLIRADTSAADSAYFVRLATAYAALNQPDQVTATVTQGLQKFPRNALLLMIQSQALQKANRNAEAIAAARRALSINPRVEGGYAQLALLYGANNQPDSVVSVIRAASANGGDRATLAQVALAQGQAAYRAGNASKNRADFQRAVRLLQLSDQLQPSEDAKFLLGASAFSVGQSAVTEAQDTRNCSLARLARESFATASSNVPAGLQKYSDAAKQLLEAIPQFTPAVDDQIRRFCR